MPKFDKNNIRELKEFIYNSYVHDAKLENIVYKYMEDIMEIALFNSISNVRIDIVFANIEIAFAIKGKEYGSRENIISLTAEDDFSYLHSYFPTYQEYIDNSIYLLFQMFSGDELHIIAESVVIEIAI